MKSFDSPDVYGHHRLLIAGVWDLFHYGHANALMRAKTLFDNVCLVVGVHNDLTTEKMKGKVVLHLDERIEMLRHIKYVDEIVPNCPWHITKEFIERHNIDYVVGEDVYGTDAKSPYEIPKALGKFIELPRTDGISTTGIVTRIVKNYDTFVLRNLSRGESAGTLKVGLWKSATLSTKSRLRTVMNWRSFNFLQSFGERLFNTWYARGMAHADAIRQAEDDTSLTPEQIDELIEFALPKCRTFVTGWTSVAPEDLRVTCVTGGLTNKLFKITLKKKIHNLIIKETDEQAPRSVLFRVYGTGTETFFEREKELTIFRKFAESRLGPLLYGGFEGGRIEEFLTSKSLTFGDFPRLIKDISSAMAKMHMTINLDIPKNSLMFDNMKHWIEQAKDCSFDEHQKRAMLAQINIPLLEKELNELEPILLALDSPISFCHNDLLYGNVMLGQETNAISFIDFEYGNYNYRGYDIGNHFCEWEFDYRQKNPPCFNFRASRFPNLEQQWYFALSYVEACQVLLKEAKESGNSIPGEKMFPNGFERAEKESVESEAAKIIQEANMFALAAQIMWALWGIIQAYNSDLNFDYLEFSRKRIIDFRMRKRVYYKAQKPSDFIIPQTTINDNNLG